MPASPPLDTSSDALALQDRRYREMGSAERVAIVFRLNATARAMTAAGIRARHPGYGDDDVRMALARVLFGDELVRKAWPDHALVDP